MWRREMEWLLRVSDSIVKVIPSETTIRCLMGLGRQLWNVDRGLVVGDGGDTHLFSVGGLSIRQEGKWWLPCPNGFLMMQQCRDGTNQLLKAAMAISSSVLVEMEIPTAHFEDLPKVLR
ncbi:hypothetical protein V6N11_021096 [Hibiscus sabdariffa]|uniref:PRONE domain-containing protein n=1 Tax=Hibiscus sabdariffa TaxID=183260 RepID=A0ABR2A5S4_9ROSI